MNWIRVSRQKDGRYGPLPEANREFVWLNTGGDLTGRVPTPTISVLSESDLLNPDMGKGIVYWGYLDYPTYMNQAALERRIETNTLSYHDTCGCHAEER